jgi:hypothetical protein
MAGDARYTALVGAAGEGEQDSPRQPYAAALFELLLERGAEPYDIQVLYNTHFSGDVLWWLELVYEQTIHTPRGAAWKDPDWPMLDMGGYGSGARFLLETAVKKRDLLLAEWLLARGANPDAPPARDKRFPKRSLYELAQMEGLPEMAELLTRYGASRSTPALDEDERFIEACFRLDAMPRAGCCSRILNTWSRPPRCSRPRHAIGPTCSRCFSTSAFLSRSRIEPGNARCMRPPRTMRCAQRDSSLSAERKSIHASRAN